MKTTAARRAPPAEVVSASPLKAPTKRRLTLQVHQLSAKIAQVANPLFRIHDLDQVSSRILVLLLEREEMHVGGLVEEMVLPQSTISHQLQRLEKRKLLQRRRARDDNRLVAVTLTRKGMTAARQCNELSLAVHSHIVQHLGESESARLSALIAKAFASLDAYQSTAGAAQKATPR